MTCLSSTTRTRIIAQIDKLEAQLVTLETTIDNSLESGIENYSFDSGEGKQATKYRSLDSLFKARDNLEAKLEKLYRRLNGGNIVNMNLRRRRYSNLTRSC